MMRPLFVASRTSASILLLGVCLLPTADSFSPASPFATHTFATSNIISTTHSPHNIHQYSRLSSSLHAFLGVHTRDVNRITVKEDEIDEECNIENLDCTTLSRRGALSQAATGTLLSIAAATTSANPAAAASITVDPTRIELNVETDYLIRTLEIFDGDMRKVLAAIVRSPFTTVQIDPPNSNKDAAKDAILRALYSYEAPEDYAQQASWLNVEATDESFAGWLTKKRYKLTLPNLEPKKYVFSEGEEKPLKFVPMEDKPDNLLLPTTISLSNLEAGVAAGVLSYPLTYAYYQYEGYREEQEAKARKAKMAAKRAVAEKAKKAADAKKKGAPTDKKASRPPPAETKKAAVSKKENPVSPAAKAKEAAAKQPKPTIKALTGQSAPSGPAAAANKRKADAEAVWRRLQAEVAKGQASAASAAATPKPRPEKPQPAAPAPVTAAPVATVSAPAPAPAAPAPASQASPCAPIGNAGMDAYDDFLKQTYAASVAPPVAAPAPAASYSPPEPDAAQEVPSQPRSAVPATPPETPKRSASPFGSYLDSL